MKSGNEASLVRGRLLPASCLFFLSCGLIAWHWVFGMRLFSDLDGGVLINAAWQQYHGAVPYRDFFTATPPLFLLPAGWAFDLGGPCWLSLMKLCCVYSVATFLWCYGIIQDGTRSSSKALLYATILQSIVLLPTSWWWYNEITWMAVVIFFGSCLSLALNPERTLFSSASFFLSCCLIGLMKVNMAVVILFLTVPLLLWDRRLRSFVLLSCTGALIVDVIFLALNRISPWDIIHNYLAVSSRISPQQLGFFLEHPMDVENAVDLCCLLFLAAGILVLLLRYPWGTPSTQKTFHAFLGIALITGLAGSVTNYERKAISGACLIMLFSFLDAHLNVLKPKILGLLKAVCLGLLFVLGLLSLVVGANREEFSYFGLDSYTTPDNYVTFQAPPLFEGMSTYPNLAQVIAETREALIDFGLSRQSGKKVFFGPAIDYSYATFNLSVPQKLPLWWEKVPSTHRGDAYPYDSFLPLYRNQPGHWIPPGAPLDPQTQRFLDFKFDACIFRRHDGIPVMSYLPGEMRADIYENYQRHDYTYITVFVRPASQVPAGH